MSRHRGRLIRQAPPKLALVVEGEAEYTALPQLARSLGVTVLRPAVFRGQGTSADLKEVARKRIAPHVQAALLSGAAKVIVVLDREQRALCPGGIAGIVHAAIAQELRAQSGYCGVPPVSVVCADRALENWLVADSQVLAKWEILTRPPISASLANVDGIDACRALKDACRPNRAYHKSRDASRLASRVRVAEPSVLDRSKSLRKFVKEITAP